MAGNRLIDAHGRVDWDEGQIRILLSGPGGETSEDIRRRARAVQKRAQRGAPFRTGRLRYSISVNTRYPSEGAEAEVTADAPYAMMVEFGRRAINLTGTGHYLNWQDRGGEVFTQTAAAVPATHFMEKALDEARD